MQPRMVLPGTVWSVTCRTNDRRFFFIPEPKLKELFAFALAAAQEKNPGVKVVVMQVMSNHYHLIVEDTEGTLPHFIQELNRMVARAYNVEKKRKGSIWGREPASWVRICTGAALLQHINYILMNCVKAQLVKRSEDWEGFNILPHMMGKKMVVKRPEMAYFSERSIAPEKLTLSISIPSMFKGMSPEKWRYQIEKKLKSSEQEALRKHGHKGFMGMERVKAEPWGRFPDKKEYMRKDHPILMSDDSEEGRAERKRVEKEFETFFELHSLAYRLLVTGQPFTFPPGTYKWARLLHKLLANVKFVTTDQSAP